MKKILLIIGTIFVVALGALGIWIYDVVQNGVRDYVIAGETVALSGFSTQVVFDGLNETTVTFSERHMPFIAGRFPFEEACPVVAADFESADLITIHATGELGTATEIFSVTNGVCTAFQP